MPVITAGEVLCLHARLQFLIRVAPRPYCFQLTHSDRSDSLPAGLYPVQLSLGFWEAPQGSRSSLRSVSLAFLCFYFRAVAVFGLQLWVLFIVPQWLKIDATQWGLMSYSFNQTRSTSPSQNARKPVYCWQLHLVSRPMTSQVRRSVFRRYSVLSHGQPQFFRVYWSRCP